MMMKPQSQKLLESAKLRAYTQLDYALHRLAADGNFGRPFTWWDAEHCQHETVAHYQHFHDFQLGDRQGEADIPLYFNSTLHEWDSVLNMPVDDLCRCADYFLMDMQSAKLNKTKNG